MTENEAIQNFKQQLSEPLSPFSITMCNMAIQALSDIQAYRAIGTIEELKALKDKHIGKDNMVISSSDLMTILNSDSEELKQYKEVGTVEEFKALKEKSVAKKIIQTVENGRMKRVFSCCGTDCTQMTSWMTPKFCPHCGSKTET